MVRLQEIKKLETLRNSIKDRSPLEQFFHPIVEYRVEQVLDHTYSNFTLL